MSSNQHVALFRDGILEELWRSTLELSLLAVAALGLGLFMVAEGSHWSADIGTFGLLLTLFPAMIALLTRRWFWASVGLLVLGSLTMPLLASRWLAASGFMALLVLPASLATVFFGTWPGLAVATLASALLFLMGGQSGTEAELSRALLVAAIWAMNALTSVTVRFASGAIERSEARYQEMSALLENARDRQLQLKQTQEDLVQANVELARLSERLDAMRQVAEEARRAKEEFVSNVSHELRTPLNMIIGFSEMITQLPQVYGKRIPPELVADVAVIQRNSQHLSELVDDVLDLSRVDAGRMALAKAWVSLDEVIESALTAVSPLFESKGLYLEQDLPEDLPLVFCDRTRIRQVILNLLSNAGRYSDRGGAKVRAWREGPNLIVSVADTGPGISPEDQQRIFEPFEQLTRDMGFLKSSSGLGLTISRRFVEMHGGKMWLQSEVAKGTEFSFSLPLTERKAPSASALSRWFSPYHPYDARGRPSLAPPPQLTLRFVVVEPEDTLRSLLKRYQGELEIVVLPTLGQAVEEVTRLPAHALIVNAPTVRDLWAELDQIESLPYGIPIIGCSLPGHREAARRLGVAHYLLKPVKPEELLSALQDLEVTVESVLLVDDQAEALQLFGRMLAASNPACRLLRALRGDQALALLRERRPDAMFLDLVMPDMDGYAVLREKALDPTIRDIPVVAISAQDPIRAPVSSNHLTVLKGGNLSSHDLLRCIGALTELLAPPDRLVEQARSETLPE